GRVHRRGERALDTAAHLARRRVGLVAQAEREAQVRPRAPVVLEVEAELVEAQVDARVVPTRERLEEAAGGRGGGERRGLDEVVRDRKSARAGGEDGRALEAQQRAE